MSALNDIVQVDITRQTQAVARASFGVFAVVSEFATDKTVAAFPRHRYYSGIQEMSDDGWGATDGVYRIAQKVFSQNPRPTQVMVGRKDAADATWADALSAIQLATDNWYSFVIDSLVPDHQQSAATWAATQKKIHFIDAVDIAKIAFDTDFVTGNDINVAVTVNGTVTQIGPVSFATDQATTIAAIAGAIGTAGFTAVADPSDTNGRTLIIATTGPVVTVEATVTGGASQPTATVTYYYPATASTDDIAAWANTQNLDRASVWYHPEATQYPTAGINGVMLPKDPGSATWAHKTIAGVSAYELTTTQRTEVLDKRANTYTQVAGVPVTQFGTVASGEYVDIIRGIDWLESRLQEEVFGSLINNDKIPFTDAGIALIEGLVRGVLDEAARRQLLVGESIVVSVPRAADVSQTDKANRNLPDVTFEADLQGAIHKVRIAGTVTV